MFSRNDHLDEIPIVNVQKRGPQPAARFLGLLSALYIAAAIVRLLFADPWTVVHYAIQPAEFKEHWIPPVPAAARVAVAFLALRYPKKDDGSDFVAHPMVLLQTVFSYAYPPHATSRNAIRGAQQVAAWLIDNGFPVEKRDAGGCSALQFAKLYGQPELAEFMLANGANPERDGNPGAVVRACRLSSSQIRQLAVSQR